MNAFIRRCAARTVSVVAVTMVAGLVAQAEIDPLIFVCQDESSIERQVAQYLREEKNLTSEFKNYAEDDIMVLYTISAAGLPTFNLLIDTMISGRNRATEQITERCIKIYGWYRLPDKFRREPYLTRIHDLNRRYMDDKWVPERVYVDKDNDIMFESFINIPGPNIPVHAEMVYDMIRRNEMAWNDYFKELDALLND